MRHFFIFFCLLFPLAAISQEETPKPLPPYPFVTTFSSDKAGLSRHLPCTWLHGAANPNDTSQYAHGCHSGHWGDVSLLINTWPESPDHIQSVRFLWKEWTPADRYSTNNNLANTFLTEVIGRYIPPSLSKSVRKAFFGKQAQTFPLQGAEIRYTFTPTSRHNVGYNLHRLEIRSTPVKQQEKPKKAVPSWMNP